MSTVRVVIERFLLHDGVNNAWVAAQLYGEKSKSNTAKLHKKLHKVEDRDFTPDELISLDAIRRAFIASLL